MKYKIRIDKIDSIYQIISLEHYGNKVLFEGNIVEVNAWVQLYQLELIN